MDKFKGASTTAYDRYDAYICTRIVVRIDCSTDCTALPFKLSPAPHCYASFVIAVITSSPASGGQRGSTGSGKRTSLRLQGFSVEDARSLDHLLQLETVVQRRLEEGNMTTRRSKKPAPNQSEGNAREEIGDG